MSPAVRYTLYRLGLFAAVYAVVWAVGALFLGPRWALGDSLSAMAVAALSLLGSGLLAVPLLSRQRQEMAAAVAGRVDRAKRAMDERTAREDRD